MSDAMANTIKRYCQNYKGQIDINQVIQGITLIVVPFMQNILQKYSEQDLHNALRRHYKDDNGRLCEGFDFIGDWRKNHPIGFNILVNLARSPGIRNRLNFDVNIATNLIVDIMTSWNWNISFAERVIIHEQIVRVKRLIHG